MDSSSIALLYGLGGAITFTIALRLFSVDYKLTHAIIATSAAGMAAFIIPNGTGMISLIIMVVVFKFLSKLEFQDFILPAFLSRLGLIPIGLYFS